MSSDLSFSNLEAPKVIITGVISLDILYVSTCEINNYNIFLSNNYDYIVYVLSFYSSQIFAIYCKKY